jgi:hypothetical protein
VSSTHPIIGTFGLPAATEIDKHLLDSAAPFLRDALTILVDVCRRMGAHQPGDSVSEEQYQAALAIAEAVLATTPKPQGS